MDLTTLFLREPLPAHLRQLLRLCRANGKAHQLTVPERKPWSNAACDGSLSQGTLKCVLAPSFETNNNAWIDSNPAHRLTDGSRKAALRIHKMRREEVQGFAPLQSGVYFHTHTHKQTQIQKQQQNGCQCGLPPRRMRSLRWQTAPKAARRPPRTTSPSNSWNTSLVAFGSRRECRAPRSTTADGFKNQLAACSLSLNGARASQLELCQQHMRQVHATNYACVVPPGGRKYCSTNAETPYCNGSL